MVDHSYYNQTTLHALGILALLVLGGGLLTVQRRYAIVPILIMACFVSPAQRLVILSFDFNVLRLMVLVGLVRVFMRNETSAFRLRGIDLFVLAWAVSTTVVATMREGTMAAFVW